MGKEKTEKMIQKEHSNEGELSITNLIQVLLYMLIIYKIKMLVISFLQL
jgi:biopolymer transport protein ExbD